MGKGSATKFTANLRAARNHSFGLVSILFFYRPFACLVGGFRTLGRQQRQILVGGRDCLRYTVPYQWTREYSFLAAVSETLDIFGARNGG